MFVVVAVVLVLVVLTGLRASIGIDDVELDVLRCRADMLGRS